MTRQFGCILMTVDVILTLGFGLALVLGFSPPAWGLLALVLLDIVTFVGLNATRRNQ